MILHPSTFSNNNNRLPTCLRGRSYPFILEQGIYQREDIGIVNSDSALLNYYNYIEQQVNGYEIQDNNEGYYAANNVLIISLLSQQVLQ